MPVYGKTYIKKETEDADVVNPVTMVTPGPPSGGCPNVTIVNSGSGNVAMSSIVDKVTMVTPSNKVTMVTPSLTEERLRDFEMTENLEIKSEVFDDMPELVHCPLYPKIECTTTNGTDLPFTLEHRVDSMPILETLSNIVGSLFKNNNKLDKRKSVEVQTLCPGSEATRFRHVDEKVCNQCNKVFSQKMHLQRHIKSVHDVIRDNFCTFCGKGFTLKSHLMEHIRAVHFKIKNRVCPVCDWKFHRQGDLNRHIKAVHRDGKVKKYSRKKQRLEEPVIRTELQENTVVTVDGIDGDKGQVLECLEVYSKEAKVYSKELSTKSRAKDSNVLSLLENALLDYTATQGMQDDSITGSTSVSIEEAGTHCHNIVNYLGNTSGYPGNTDGYPGNNDGYPGNNDGYPGNSRKRLHSDVIIKEEVVEQMAFPQINIEPVMQSVTPSAVVSTSITGAGL